jgi:hypothetical protein
VRARVVLCLALLGTAACTRGFEEAASSLTIAPTISASAPASPSASPGASGSIVVRRPAPQAEVSSPVKIVGVAEVTGDAVTIEIFDAIGELLAAVNAHPSCGSGCRGRFATTLAFVTPERQRGTVAVFEAAGDGSVTNLVRVPVILEPGA